MQRPCGSWLLVVGLIAPTVMEALPKLLLLYLQNNKGDNDKIVFLKYSTSVYSIVNSNYDIHSATRQLTQAIQRTYKDHQRQFTPLHHLVCNF